VARLATVVVAALLVAGCGSARTVTRTVTVEAPQQLGGGADQVIYGRIVSMSPAAGGYFLRFDPAWWLTGITANVALAHAEHRTCSTPGCTEVPVPNDYYALDEGHGTLTYVLPHTAHGTVLTKPLRFPGTRIGADRLARLVAQGPRADLFEPLASGVWLRVHSDTVREFAQQYRP
jgi:hypothetical protein